MVQHGNACKGNALCGIEIITSTKQSWKKRRMVAGPETGDSLNCWLVMNPMICSS
jgi:hypothetical protein